MGIKERDETSQGSGIRRWAVFEEMVKSDGQANAFQTVRRADGTSVPNDGRQEPSSLSPLQTPSFLSKSLFNPQPWTMFKPKARVAPAAGSGAGGMAGLSGKGGSSSSSYSAREIPRLSFYFDPPRDEITIHEFESWALDRLQVLKAIETASLRSGRKDDADTRGQLAQTVTRYLPLSTGTESKDAFMQRKKDLVSHFILRLAFARTEDTRAWFLRQEAALFRIRWEACYESERAEFVASLNLDLERISSDVSEKVWCGP